MRLLLGLGWVVYWAVLLSVGLGCGQPMEPPCVEVAVLLEGAALDSLVAEGWVVMPDSALAVRELDGSVCDG